MELTFKTFFTRAKGKSRYLIRRISEELFWQWRVGRHVAKKVEVQQFGAQESTDISDHLNFLSLLIHLQQPKAILELGTRGGESTRVLESYCRDFACIGRSIDLEPAPDWLERSSHWKHFLGDDCSLGESIYKTKAWPDGTPFQNIDLLFIDTSHEYPHTKKELETFFPLLAPKATMIFHDTNLMKTPTRRLDGRLGYGWDNQRGVIRAIEEFFSIEVLEMNYFFKDLPGTNLKIYHRPWNNGFTVIQRF